MNPPGIDRNDEEFLIETTICEGDPVDREEVRQAMEHLGGVETKGGFGFATEHDRDIALELLYDRFGSRYVVAVRG